jgi:hypothetical protein
VWLLRSAGALVFIPQLLLILGIVEGAILIGWRLSQLPKCRFLEYFFVTPIQASRLFAFEAVIGVGWLLLVTLSGFPLLTILIVEGFVGWADLLALLGMPATWGTVVGLGLTAWSYEPMLLRRWGGRLFAIGLCVYLFIGVVAGEHIGQWLALLPDTISRWFFNGFEALHRYNPFAVMAFWFEQPVAVAWDRMVGLEVAALMALLTTAAVAALRMRPHFEDLHYGLRQTSQGGGQPNIGDRPLTWWALGRVQRYSGRLNLWLASGFGFLYALYIVCSDVWPPWLGRGAFVIFDRAGGVPVVTTALVLLAAVPAAFQYGLWDSHVTTRCRRLELLLLTGLEARDYWRASARAAWCRGKGYFAVALVLWLAAWTAGTIGVQEFVGSVFAGVALCFLYFALGFRAMCRGKKTTVLAFFLTVGLPLLTLFFYRLGFEELAAWAPPAIIYQSSLGVSFWKCGSGIMLWSSIALVVSRRALVHGHAELRLWYERQQLLQSLQ